MVCKVKTISKKTGEEKTYEYDHQKYYDNYKEKKGRVVCDKCGHDVNRLYLEKHQTKKVCMKKAAENEKRELQEGEEIEKKELLETLEKTLQILHQKFGIKR